MPGGYSGQSTLGLMLEVARRACDRGFDGRLPSSSHKCSHAARQFEESTSQEAARLIYGVGRAERAPARVEQRPHGKLQVSTAESCL